MSHRLVAFSACLAVASAVPAAADVLDTALPAPAWTKMVGTMRVERYGDGAPALILVPGLGCGSWSWRGTIAREAKSHAVYAVTLAGFDGVPFNPEGGLDSADAGLATLISSERIERPVLVGHSLGGLLALRFGSEHANVLRGVVSLDGLPVQPQFAQATAAQREAAAAGFAAGITAQTPAQFHAAEAQYMRDLITDPALAAHATTMVLRSDQRALARYGQQVFAADIRAAMPQLTVPSLLIAPVPGLPLPSYLPAAMANMSMTERTTATVGFYRSLVGGAPSMKIVPIQNARHFAMLDQPDDFGKALDDFIASLT